MVEAAWIEAEVLKAVPEATVEVVDLHGSGDHFHVRVISETFEGVRPLQRQKQVLAVMKQHIPVQELSLDDIFASDINTSPLNVACGRKLEFIAQDLSKKINILSSKINNHKSISAVISFKESLEEC